MPGTGATSTPSWRTTPTTWNLIRPPSSTAGNADGWIRGKLRLRANFEVGIKAPNLRFDLIDVLLGVGVICIIYRRETGTLVSGIVELNAEGFGSRVLSCYSRVRK